MSVSKINICNLNLDNVTMEETLQAMERLIDSGKPHRLANINVDMLVRANKDSEFFRYLNTVDLLLADGTPILWAATILNTPLKAKVAGSDLVPRVCAWASQKGYRLFFSGGRPGAAQAAKEKATASHPGLKVVGVYSPPFGFEKDEEELKKITAMIKAARPDILFVGLGAPKQEKWIGRFYQELGVPVSMGVGVTFEFMAGIVKRAPKWMQDAGLEWFWRLCMEPRRLWKRYLVDDMQFFVLLLKQKLGKS